MKKIKMYTLVLSFFLYMSAIILYALEPLKLLFNKDYIIFDANTLCIILTMFSFFCLIKSIQIKKTYLLYTILFIMIYFALIIGNNNVFDYVLKKLIKYYEEQNLINSEQYEKLWDIWSNDLSRNLMYFFAIFYSFFATFIYFLLRILKNVFTRRKIRKKSFESIE